MATILTEQSSHPVAELLDQVDVRVGGSRPWDIRVLDDRFFQRFPAEGSIGLGESYMDGWWECDRIDQMVHRLLDGNLEEQIRRSPRLIAHLLWSRVGNLQNRRRARRVAEVHYDLDASLYMSFLDPYNQYTCAYWKDAADLDTAQEHKLDLICRKLQLREGQRVLDIGCGWGGFARFAAERYGARVTGVTLSSTQAAYAREACAGLPVEILEMDYREVPARLDAGAFDRVLVCGMIEHVGYKNYRSLMEAVHHALRDGGLFLLHTIGSDVSVTTITTHRFIAKYIFPNGMTPSIRQLAGAAEGLFVVEDLHQFGPSHYDRTLMAWDENFQRNWDDIRDRYDERFYRMWRFYLLSCAGGFRVGKGRLWQFVMSKGGIQDGYAAVR